MDPGRPVGLTRAAGRRETVTAALESIAGTVCLDGVRRVLVKPNFVTPRRQLAATHVDAVRAVLDFLRQRFDGPIVVAEGTAFHPTADGFHNYGYEPLVQEYGVELRDLNADEGVPVTVRNRRMRSMELHVARTVVDADFRVSVCPPKTHDTVQVTLSIKNVVMGALINRHAGRDGSPGGVGPRVMSLLRRLVPAPLRHSPLAEWAKGIVFGGSRGSHKMAMHQGIPILNLNLALVAPTVWPHLAVIDGWQGMEGAGPEDGDPVDWRLALAGTDPLALDSLAAHLMGFDPLQVGYFHYCGLQGLGVNDPAAIPVVGNLRPAEAARAFVPHPTFAQQQHWHLEGAALLVRRDD